MRRTLIPGKLWTAGVLACVLAGVVLAYPIIEQALHSLAPAPARVPFARRGLAMEIPSGWLAQPDRAPATAALARRILDRHPARSPARRAEEAALALVYGDPADPDRRVEIAIVPRPGCGNLTAALAVERRSVLMPVQATRTVVIGATAWRETRFHPVARDATRAGAGASSAVEYARAQGPWLYTVTFHGRRGDAERLAGQLAPSLTLESAPDPAPAHHGPREDPGQTGGPQEGAARATVAILAMDERNGALWPAASGSGAIVSPGGAVLTSFHLLQDETTMRLHDLFVIVHPGVVPDEPGLLCAGHPTHGELDSDRDLALITCELDIDGHIFVPTGWPTIPLGKASSLAPGDAVRVLGYPDGADGRLTSEPGRFLGGPTSARSDRAAVDSLARTDARIEPGSSGGPVLDHAGNLIGIVMAFRDRTAVSVRDGSRFPLPSIGLFRAIESAGELLATAHKSATTAAGDPHPVSAGPRDP